jgi:hypothetical protein
VDRLLAEPLQLFVELIPVMPERLDAVEAFVGIKEALSLV